MRGTPRARLVAVAVPMALALAACGQSGGAGGDFARSDEPVTIRVTWWGEETRADLTNQAIEAFEEQYPDIDVRGEFKDWAGYWDALATTTAGGDSPDVIQMDELYLASYAERGSLLDLGEAGEFLDTSQFDEESLKTGQIDGTQYAMPIGVGVMASVLNADLFEQYGVELPDDATWTWDDYAELANELTEKSGGAINGSSATGGNDAGSIKYWARLHGNELFGEDGTVTLDPENLASMWQYNLDLMESGGAESAAQGVESFNAGIEAGSLATGKIAMGGAYNTQITALREASGADLRLMRLPGSGEVDANFLKPSMYWALSSQSEHPAEAALFMDFMLNHEAAADILGTDRGVPANNAMRERISQDLSESDQLAVDYMNSVTPGPSPVVTPSGGSGIEPMIQRYTQEVYSGQRSPQDAAQAFVDELQTEVDAAAR
ncbi:ABC transporter substrate-binding protein [Streptomyces litchfieldiae]|uniref:Extracellular solute-binding protein n=1 Tax=Streptomyces litchfieldiae TaxID=3075543 RepID=A0ABU2MM20_9ACTN|nr:extracellular solute-binding protein [Streptomyces sp. DSM 44938]MDT0342647.1 extracellular solute-binding protein [Streptomyces sp. DSM 44938]